MRYVLEGAAAAHESSLLLSSVPASSPHSSVESIGDATLPGVALSWEYPGIVSIRAEAMPGRFVFATPGWHAEDEELASGTVHVPVQWYRDDVDGDCTEVDDLALAISGDLATDVAAYLRLVPAIVAAVTAAGAKP